MNAATAPKEPVFFQFASKVDKETGEMFTIDEKQRVNSDRYIKAHSFSEEEQQIILAAWDKQREEIDAYSKIVAVIRLIKQL